MSGTLFFRSGDPVFMAATQTSLLSDSGGQGVLHCWSPDCNNQTVLSRLPRPGHYTDSRLKYTPVFLRKRPMCLYRNFDIRGRLPGWQTSRLLWRGSNRTDTSGHNLCTVLLPHFSSLVSSRKELIPLTGAMIFVVIAKVTLHIGSGGQWGLCVWVHESVSYRKKVL